MSSSRANPVGIEYSFWRDFKYLNKILYYGQLKQKQGQKVP